MTRCIAMVLGLASAAGCGGRTYLPCNGTNEDTPATIDLSSGVPVFDWEYGTAYALSVYELTEDGGTGRDMWHVQCGGDNLSEEHTLEESVCIETPIAYGDHVDSPYLDTVNLTRPKPLMPGVRYEMMLDTMTQKDAHVPDRGPAWLDFLDWHADRDDPHCGSGFGADQDFVAPDAEDAGSS